MHIIVVLSALLLCASLTTVRAEPGSIAGLWSGSGTVGYRGQVDRVFCRSRFAKTSAKSFSVSSVCTTENGRYDIAGHVTSTGGGRYRGTVMSNNVSGRVTLFYSGRQMSVTVTSQQGSAQMTLARR